MTETDDQLPAMIHVTLSDDGRYLLYQGRRVYLTFERPEVVMRMIQHLAETVATSLETARKQETK